MTQEELDTLIAEAKKQANTSFVNNSWEKIREMILSAAPGIYILKIKIAEDGSQPTFEISQE